MIDLAEFVQARERLLSQIIEVLANDEHFIAAWLTGSYGRGEADQISDLDLNIVVDDESLTKRPWQSGGETTPERYALISRFGQVGILFEAHANAPPGGTFTSVFYAKTGVPVDWTLLPLGRAKRPVHSQLLFEKQPIPIQVETESETLEERIDRASREVAYFWMMMAIIVKYIIRQDSVAFHLWLNAQHHVLHSVKRLVSGEAQVYLSGSYIGLIPTVEEQKAAVRELCEKMLTVMPTVVAIGGTVPENPMDVVEKRLAMVQKC